MDKVFEINLMKTKLKQCAVNDVYLMCVTDKDRGDEEFEYYSDTSKVMKELTDKYNFAPEVVSMLKHTYDLKVRAELLKI